VRWAWARCPGAEHGPDSRATIAGSRSPDPAGGAAIPAARGSGLGLPPLGAVRGGPGGSPGWIEQGRDQPAWLRTAGDVRAGVAGGDHEDAVRQPGQRAGTRHGIAAAPAVAHQPGAPLPGRQHWQVSPGQSPVTRSCWFSAARMVACASRGPR
jgi:hypothetical protein